MSLFQKSQGAPDTTSNGDYNLLLGPVSLRADASISATYNDNINTSESKKTADLIIAPEVTFSGFWQVTDLNVLTFGVGLGYQEYIFNPNNSGVTVSPNSLASFTFSLGDINFRISDAISYQQDPVLVGQLSNTTQFPTLSNTFQTTASWDWTSNVSLSGSYSHSTQAVFANSFNYLDYQSDVFSPQVTYKLSDTISTGLNSSYTNTRYDKKVQNDSNSFTVGPFANAEISSNLSVNAQAGYINTIYATGGSNGDQSNVNSYTASVGVTHQINQAFSQTLSAGKDFLPGLTSNSTDRVYADYSISWLASSAFSISADISAENLKDSTALLSQNSNRIQGGVNINYNLSTKLKVNLRYDYTKKDSNVANLSYDQTRFTLGCDYRF